MNTTCEVHYVIRFKRNTTDFFARFSCIPSGTEAANIGKLMGPKISDHIFTKIDETIFAPLYSEKSNSRPNAPINVIVGALIFKEFNGLTDDEIIEEMECDIRYQYALHIMSYDR